MYADWIIRDLLHMSIAIISFLNTNIFSWSLWSTPSSGHCSMYSGHSLLIEDAGDHAVWTHTMLRVNN